MKKRSVAFEKSVFANVGEYVNFARKNKVFGQEAIKLKQGLDKLGKKAQNT